MAKSDSGEGAMAKLSQESHLLSPEISTFGSDDGQLEDLMKGESFSELAKEAPAGAAAATSSRRQQTSLKTSAPLADPGTYSNTTGTNANKSKNDPSQTSRKPGKSNNAKKSTKATMSASRRPTPINIQIVRVDTSPSSLSSSQSSSSTHTRKTSGGSASSQYGPAAHTFTMNMLPMTKIRELCLHASAHARRHLDLVLDGSRFEARDRDGHVFGGHETISEEILSGETIYLVEGGLDARGAAAAAKSARSSSRGRRGGSEKPRGGSRSRERGRLLCLKRLELEGEDKRTSTPYRTPSVSSRASSSQSGASKAKSEPRMTPSQRALAIAQMGRTPETQRPTIERRRPVPASSAVKKTLPSPALEKVGECSDRDEPGEETLVGEPAESDDLERTLVAASPPLRSSTPPPPSPPKPPKQHHQHEVPPNLQDSQLVIPDSQDPFSQGLFSQQSVELQPPAPPISMADVPDARKAQTNPSPRVKASATTTQKKLPTCRPDPYDINTVLSEEDDDGSDESNSNYRVRMASSIRKLGSEPAKRRSFAPPPASLPSPRRAQSNPPPPSHSIKAAVSKPSTPTKKATPIKAEPSSPAVPLPSSPTNRVAAAVAKGGQRAFGRNRQPQLPSPGQMVFRVPSDSDSDDELIEEAFRDLSSSIPTPSLPWSQPPLRAVPGGEASVENHPARRGGSISSTLGEVGDGVPIVDTVPVTSRSPHKSPLRKPLPSSPRKNLSQRSPIKGSSIITSPSKREEATIIHDSSSAVESEEDQDIRVVKKEIGTEGSPLRKTRLADIPTIPETPQKEGKKKHEVIELSSGSDSDIELPADMLEDEDVAELPSINTERPFQRAKSLPLPLSPARADRTPIRNSLRTDLIKIEPAYKDLPPSAQTSKRKRPTIEEPDPEDENRRRKRVKREAKKAKKLRKREQEAAMLLQKEEEEELAALQEERKKVALEKAHRRALELEIIVSSPIKREPSIEPGEEGDDDDSGLGSSAYGDDMGADANRAGALQLDGDDETDLSKVSRDTCADDSLDHLAVPPTSTPAIIEAQLQQCVEERFHRMPFDDWAFLENTLGKGLGGGYGHSSLEVHNRVHLDMMHRAQHPLPHTSGRRGSTNTPEELQEELPKLSALDDRAVEDEAAARARSKRSHAPSPKEHDRSPEEHAPSPKEHEVRQKTKTKTKTKTKSAQRLGRERSRKWDRERTANSRYHHNFRGSRVGPRKQKQKQKREGNGH